MTSDGENFLVHISCSRISIVYHNIGMFISRQGNADVLYTDSNKLIVSKLLKGNILVIIS